MRKTMCRKISLLAIVGMFCAGSGLAQEGPSVIRIKPSVDWDMSGGDDMARLKKLAAGVGWEFTQNAKTVEGLKQIGTRRLRCINVNLGGTFDKKGKFVASPNPRMDSNLATCRAIGAAPHVIIANGVIHPDLYYTPEALDKFDDKLTLGGQQQKRVYGPNDWGKFRSWIKAHFQYVLIDKGVRNAVFEIGNEPDIGKRVEKPPLGTQGSRRTFDTYFKKYKAASEAAREFEKENPGVKVTLGGPTITWAFTFRFGDFNWTERFLRLAGKEKLKLDFLSLHFYGNLAPLTGESPNHAYPSFSRMMHMTRKWRDKYTPGLPIHFSEWGGSYHVNSTPGSMNANAGNVGASFAAAFLNQMLIEGVDEALYLVTTDLVKQGRENVWGWCSFFTNPASKIGFHPKAPYHVFQMVNRMENKRVESTHPGGYVDCIASRSDSGKLTIMVWNHSYRIDEFGMGVEQGQKEAVNLRIFGADKFFGGQVKMKRWLVSETVSNAYYLFKKGEKLDKRAELQQVAEGKFTPVDGILDIGLALPPSSVFLIEIVPVKK